MNRRNFLGAMIAGAAAVLGAGAVKAQASAIAAPQADTRSAGVFLGGTDGISTSLRDGDVIKTSVPIKFATGTYLVGEPITVPAGVTITGGRLVGHHQYGMFLGGDGNTYYDPSVSNYIQPTRGYVTALQTDAGAGVATDYHIAAGLYTRTPQTVLPYHESGG